MMNTLMVAKELTIHSAIECRFMPHGENKIITTMPDDTMQGEIEAGAVIAIDTTPQKFIEDGIYAFWWDGYLMVKRLQFMPGIVRVIPTSKHYHSWEIELAKSERLEIIGRVVASQNIRRH